MLIKGVPIGPSPDWLRKRIEAMGLRPINNVVDVTNYVLFATGQPLHSFDFGKLAGGRVLVRRAKKNETLKSLDGANLALTTDMLVIADAEKPIAVAGVMGGEETGINETTQDIFIESATFDSVSVRMTAKKLGLATDASYRFERGADISFAPQAALMAASLLCSFGGKAAKGMIDVYPKPRKSKAVILREQRVKDLLGAEIPSDFVIKIFQDLGFKIDESKKGVWKIEVPSFRVDIEREADLIEEIARFYGYDKIPSQVTPLLSFDVANARKKDKNERIRQVLLHEGFDEVINFSFSDPEKEAAAASGREPVRLRNPLSSRSAVMRTNLLIGLLENVSWNMNRGLEGVHIFEIGNIHYVKDEGIVEHPALGLVGTGSLGRRDWMSGNSPTNFFVLKGAVEALLSFLRYDPIAFEEAGHPFFEEGASLSILYKGQAVGSLGVVNEKLRKLYSLDGPVFAAEINLASLLEKQPRPFHFTPVPKYPGMIRDLSFLVDGDVSFREIQKAMTRLSSPCLEGFELTDRFTGSQVPDGKVSLSIRFRFRNPKRTLLAEEVDKAQQDIVGYLKSALNIQLREGGKIDNRN